MTNFSFAEQVLESKGYTDVTRLFVTNFGITVRCLQRESKTNCVVKITDLHKICTANTMEDVKQETSFLTYLQSDMNGVNNNHFTKLVDQFQIELDEDLYHFLIMESGGTDLFTLLKAGSLTFQRKKNIWYQLVEAVESMHAAKVVHLDLKLENILVEQVLINGISVDKVRICDFGRARDVSQNSLVNFVYGTQVYQSPEACDEKQGGNRNYCGYQADIFALGVCFYVMLKETFMYNIWRSQNEQMYEQMEYLKFVRKSSPSDRFHEFHREQKFNACIAHLLTGVICPAYQRKSLQWIKNHQFTKACSPQQA